MSGTAPVTVAPAQYVTYGASQAGVPMEPVAGAGPVTYQASPYGQAAAGQITYGAPQVVSTGTPQIVTGTPQVVSTGPPVYVTQSEASQQPVTYVQAPQEPGQAAAAPVTYAAAPTVTYSQAPVSYTVQGGASQFGAAYTTTNYQLPSAPSMVAYPSAAASSYFPMSVQQAWDNHFGAFGAKSLDKIMLDYDETSIVRVYENQTGKLTEYVGTARIREFFANTFAMLPDMTTLEAPVSIVDDEHRQVFLVWKCPGCGVNWANDTFIFGPDFKIKRQNVVLDGKAGSAPAKGSAAAAGAAAATSAVSSSKASKKKEKGSKKKLSSKKKKGGFC